MREHFPAIHRVLYDALLRMIEVTVVSFGRPSIYNECVRQSAFNPTAFGGNLNQRQGVRK